MNTLKLGLVLGLAAYAYAGTTEATSELGSLDTAQPVLSTIDLSGDLIAPAQIGITWLVLDEHPGSLSLTLHGAEDILLAEYMSFSGETSHVITEPGDYSLEIEAVDAFGNQLNSSYDFAVDVVVGANEQAYAFGLQSIYPNPFNPVTQVEFHMAQLDAAKLRVFNVAGHEVATLVDGMLEQGVHTISVDGSHWSSGIYFAVFEAGGVVDTQKLILSK